MEGATPPFFMEALPKRLPQNSYLIQGISSSQRIPCDWHIYLHLVDFYGFHVGKYTSPMDPMGFHISIFVGFKSHKVFGGSWLTRRLRRNPSKTIYHIAGTLPKTNIALKIGLAKRKFHRTQPSRAKLVSRRVSITPGSSLPSFIFELSLATQGALVIKGDSKDFPIETTPFW